MSRSPILRVRFSLSYFLRWFLFWYDCFLGKPLDLQSIVTGWRKPCLTHVHYRVFPIRYFKLSDKQDLCRFCGWENIIFPTPPFPHSDLPRSSEELKNWMIRLYQVILVLVFFLKNTHDILNCRRRKSYWALSTGRERSKNIWDAQSPDM